MQRTHSPLPASNAKVAPWMDTKKLANSAFSIAKDSPAFDDFSDCGDSSSMLKMLIEEFKACAFTVTGPAAHQLAKFLRERQNRLELHARELLKELVTFNASQKSSQTIASASPLGPFKQQAKVIQNSCLAIKEFSFNLADIMADIQDSQANVELIADDQVLETVRNYISGGTNIVVLLSDILSVIRSIESKDQSSEDKWVAPSSFERSTHKYWVDETYLTDVMLSCVTEVPMLIYGTCDWLSGCSNVNDYKNLQNLIMYLCFFIKTIQERVVYSATLMAKKIRLVKST